MQFLPGQVRYNKYTVSHCSFLSSRFLYVLDASQISYTKRIYSRPHGTDGSGFLNLQSYFFFLPCCIERREEGPAINDQSRTATVLNAEC